MPLAYSYIRFSHPSQSEGDSLRRQTEAAAEYCRRNSLTLDKQLSLRDLGVSAWRGKNAAVGNFRTFLDAIRAGKVAPGSTLIVESIDRISRQGIDEGYDLIKGILKSGIRIVTLSPERKFDIEATKSLSKGALEIQLILERAAEESERKSDRVGSAWANKRKNAASKVVTRKLPGWIRFNDGKLAIDPEAAKTVRRIFAMAREGLGVMVIAKRLNEEGVEVLGRKEFKGKPVVWSETVVYCILKSLATVGIFQPCKGRGSDRQPCGEPIQNYFPAVISAEEFHAVHGIIKSRAKNGRGRRGSHVNLFAGLLIDARDGGSLTYKHLSTRPPALIPTGAKRGKGTKWCSFPVAPFESAIMSKLTELKASDISGDDATGLKVESISGQLADVDALIKSWSAKMDDLATVDIVASKLADLNSRRKKLAEALADAQREAASPISESWKGFRSLADLLAKDSSDELRMKLRAALRRSIESIHCVFTGSGRLRLAAVRVQFRGSDRHRDYFIAYDPPAGALPKGKERKRPAKYEVVSAAWDKQGLEIDLRKMKDAGKAERVLKTIGKSLIA